MSWFSGNSKNQRQRQIKSLEQVPNARCIDSHHKAEWRVTINTSLGDRTLYVNLPDDFPAVAPRLRIDSNLQHSFADDHGNIVNMHELKFWTQTSSDVGRLINSIISQFQSEPPQIKSAPRSSYKMNPPPYGMQNQPYSHVPHTDISSQVVQSRPSYHEKDMTLDLSSITLSVPKDIWQLPSVEKLTETQMVSLLSDETAMRDFAYETASGIREMRASSQEGLLATAKTNLKKKQEIDATGTEIKKLRNDINQLTQKFIALKEKQQKLLQNYAPPRLLAEFENGLTKVDDQCEEVRKKFQEKELTEQQFVKAYTELRILYHMLGTKKEKFAAFYT